MGAIAIQAPKSVEARLTLATVAPFERRLGDGCRKKTGAMYHPSQSPIADDAYCQQRDKRAHGKIISPSTSNGRTNPNSTSSSHTYDFLASRAGSEILRFGSMINNDIRPSGVYVITPVGFSPNAV